MNRAVSMYFKDGISDKVWEAKLSGKNVECRWGRRGIQKELSEIDNIPNEFDAMKFYDNKFAEKRGKGYLMDRETSRQFEALEPKPVERRSVRESIPSGISPVVWAGLSPAMRRALEGLPRSKSAASRSKKPPTRAVEEERSVVRMIEVE